MNELERLQLESAMLLQRLRINYARQTVLMQRAFPDAPWENKRAADNEKGSQSVPASEPGADDILGE